MLYPLMSAPPVLDGAVHLKLILVGPDADAVSSVGALGAVAAGATVVALATSDGGPVPTELIALTR